jgi:hypothetical protein
MRPRVVLVVFSVLVFSSAGRAQETERIKPPAELPIPMVKEPGFMDPPALQALLHQVLLTEYRVNDLLADVHPEHWKLPEAVRSAVGNSVTEIRSQMHDMDHWRGELEKRPASAYLVFETYQALSTLPPRLDALARLVSENESPSFGAEYAAVGNRFLDAQQTLGSYLGYLLRNQDQIVAAMEGNLSTCQRELGEAMRGRGPKATPIPNERPIRPARRRTQRHATSGGRSSASGEKAGKLQNKTAGSKKPVTAALAKPQPKNL